MSSTAKAAPKSPEGDPVQPTPPARGDLTVGPGTVASVHPAGLAMAVIAVLAVITVARTKEELVASH